MGNQDIYYATDSNQYVNQYSNIRISRDTNTFNAKMRIDKIRKSDKEKCTLFDSFNNSKINEIFV